MATSRSLELEQFFPGLLQSEYEVTSPPTTEYNCIAWAAGDNSRWWEPDPAGIYYWPPDVTRAYTLESYATAFAKLGYDVLLVFSERESETEDSVDDLRTVVLYMKDGIPQHAARKLPTGVWTSKCGQLEDISHELKSLEGAHYGKALVYLSSSSDTQDV